MTREGNIASSRLSAAFLRVFFLGAQAVNRFCLLVELSRICDKGGAVELSTSASYELQCHRSNVNSWQASSLRTIQVGNERTS